MGWAAVDPRQRIALAAVHRHRDHHEAAIGQLLVERLPHGQVATAPSPGGPGDEQDLLAAVVGEPVHAAGRVGQREVRAPRARPAPPRGRARSARAPRRRRGRSASRAGRGGARARPGRSRPPRRTRARAPRAAARRPAPGRAPPAWPPSPWRPPRRARDTRARRRGLRAVHRVLPRIRQQRHHDRIALLLSSSSTTILAPGSCCSGQIGMNFSVTAQIASPAGQSVMPFLIVHPRLSIAVRMASS